MNLFDAIKLGSSIGKYIIGKISKFELEEIETWLKGNKKNQGFLDSLKEGPELAKFIDEIDRFNRDVAWKRYLEQVKLKSHQKRFFQWKIAVVFLFLLSFSGLLLFFGKNIKTLLAIRNGYATVSTSMGQNSKIVLSDSSIIWMNAGTNLSYNNDFGVKNREIKLEGQAYFQITRNEEVPLTVYSNDLRIKVLGTKFDVSAYPEDENVSVVLESGSVELTYFRDKENRYLLKPGEKADYNKSSKKLRVNEVDTYKFTSWKDGLLIFKDDPMDKVFEKLERWYNVKIEVQNEIINKKQFNATIVNESMKEIFDLIEFTCDVNCEIIPSEDPKIPVKIIVSIK